MATTYLSFIQFDKSYVTATDNNLDRPEFFEFIQPSFHKAQRVEKSCQWKENLRVLALLE